MIKRVFKMLLLLLSVHAVSAQQVGTTTEQQLENLSEQMEEETEDDTYLQQLQYLLQHPININTATEEELQILKSLSSLQIFHLLQYRQRLGALISIYELQAVPMWDVLTIRKVLPYITVQTPLNERVFKRFTSGDHFILGRVAQVLEKQKGFQNVSSSHYAGSPQRYLLRYQYQYKNLLQYGVTADKDAGEQFFKGAQSKGFDFYSVHFFARQIGVIKSVALGDYSINMGQGLVQWLSLAFKKSADVLAIERQAPLLTPYRSAGEFYFNRGAAITINKKKWESTVFASYRKLDANIVADSLQEESYFTSFGTTGYHRTATEIEKQGALNQTSFGGNITYKIPSFKIAANAVQYAFSHALEKREEPYNLYAINGKRWFNTSIDYNATVKNAHVFGEAAVDQKGNVAFMQGALLALDAKIDAALLYRNISAAYQSLYGNAFTENSMPANENGLYAGVSIRPVTGVKIQAYADMYRFPFIKYRVDAPGSGKDYLLQINYQPDKQMEIYGRFRFEQKSINEPDNLAPISYVGFYSKSNLRLHLAYNINRMVAIKSRLESVWYQVENQKREDGFLVFVEGSYKPSFKFSANGRLQFFQTGSYNSRIYVYENDVLYSFSIPAFYDKGLRYYFNMNYDFSKKLSAWLRFAQTIYNDKKSVGSGLDASEGNKRTEAKIQFRLIL